MRVPESLLSLADMGIIEEVVRPLMSGKEAQVYLVIAGGEQRVAKIYKEAENRSFKHRAEYTEGRKVRNTRDQRAISKRSSHGRAQDEAAWRSTEVNMIYRLQAAGVRVPVPYHFIDGVLVMELVTDGEGNPAPRLGDLAFDAAEAAGIYQHLLREVVKMLCAGVVHGDLSDFNVLMSGDGPVLIDFPQSVDAAHNQNARKLLLRDVNNLHDFLARFDRGARRLPLAEEMWALYESNQLTPETTLSGRYQPSHRAADTGSVLSLIEDARRDEQRRREVFGIKGGAGAAGRARPQGTAAAGPRDNRGPRPADPGQARPNPNPNPNRQGQQRPNAPSNQAPNRGGPAPQRPNTPSNQAPNRGGPAPQRPNTPTPPGTIIDGAPREQREGGRSRRRRRGRSQGTNAPPPSMSSVARPALPSPSPVARPAPRPEGSGPPANGSRRRPGRGPRPPRRPE